MLLLMFSELKSFPIRVSPGQQQQGILTCISNWKLAIWPVYAARLNTGHTYNCPGNENPYQYQLMESLTEDIRTECNTQDTQCTVKVEYPELDDSCVVIAADTVSNDEVREIHIDYECIELDGRYSGPEVVVLHP